MSLISVVIWLPIVVGACLAAGWIFQQALILFFNESAAKFIRTAPLTASFGMLTIIIYIVFAVFAPLIAPYEQFEILAGAFEPWAFPYVLGTDNLGRDVFSRLVYGARNTVGIAFLITALAFIVGTALGIYSALRGGLIDQVFGRFIDVLMAIPTLIFSLLMLTIFGTSVLSLVLVQASVWA